jgi:prolyl-tRNA synthetase
MSEKLGVETKRSQDFSQWYLEVVRKGNFIDQRSPVKGFDVILPWGYAVWEIIQRKFDDLIKANGVVNAYFPLVIPEHLIKKEEKHFEGFKAEAFKITEAGGQKLDEPLYIRPTSETVMYYMYALWIRSYKDLPLKINQWNNVARFDTKITKPFIRGREFLWQEGHTAHATREDAEKWVHRVVEMYSEICKTQAIEPLILMRPKSDTFAGADFTVVLDIFLQDGRIVQGPGTHMLGQNFSKPFGIQYLDKNGNKQYVWQTSWGMSTRQIGILISHHGDDKGAILPPEIAPYQCVVVPILFKGKEEKILKGARNVRDKLLSLGLRTYLDDRDYTAGFKFNEWELRGVPLRVEVGPQDLKNKEVTVVKRTDSKRLHVKLTKLTAISRILKDIQDELLDKSRKFLRTNIADVKDMHKLKEEAKKGGIFRANWCGSDNCEKNIKAESGGAEIRGMLYGKEETPFANCIYCGKPAKHVVYIAKAY